MPSARELAEQRRMALQRAINRLKLEASTEIRITPKQTWSIPKPPPGVIPENARMAMDEAMDGFTGWALQNSLFAEGQAFLGYPYLAELSQRPEYRVISETWAQEMTRKWIRLVSTGDSDIGDKEEKLKALEAELKRLKAQDCFKKCIELDGFFGRAQIYLDLDVDTQDREELKSPIGDGAATSRLSRAKVKKNSLKHLRVIEPIWTYPNSYNANDPLKPDFFKPSTWFVMGQEIHTTRLLTFIGRPMPDLLKPAYSFGGLSLSQMAKPYIDNWLRTRQSVSDAISNFSIMVLLTDMAAMLDEGATTDLIQRAEFFNVTRDNRGLMLADNNTEDLKNVSMPISGLDHLQAQAQEHMSGPSQIPLVKLTGISPSGLNATSEYEVQVFYDKVEAQQVSYLNENLSKLINFVQLSLFGEIDPEIGFLWEPLEALDSTEIATQRKTEADTDIEYINAGVISPMESRTRLANDEESPYAALDLSEEAMPEPPEQPGQETDEHGHSIGSEESPDAEEGASPTQGTVSQGNTAAEKGNKPVESKPVAGAQDSEFVEEEHPRNEVGEFTTNGFSEKKLTPSSTEYTKGDIVIRADKFPSGKIGFYHNQGGMEESATFKDALKAALKEKNRNKSFDVIPNTWKGESKRIAKKLIDVFGSVDFRNSTQSKSKYIILPSGNKVRMSDHPMSSAYDDPDYDFRFGNDVDAFIHEVIEKEKTQAHDIAMDFNPAHNPDNGEFAKGTGEASGRKNVSTSKELPVDNEGNVTLTHYSKTPGITALNPHMYGSGLRGAEAKRMQADPRNWVSRSYHYIGEQRKEGGLGNIKYTSKVPVAKLYDFANDPDNLFNKNVGEESNPLNVYEQAIKRHGYTGYYVNNPHFDGMVAATFNSLPVTQAQDAEWNPDLHPRGQPENAGEFAKSAGSKTTTSKYPAPTKTLPDNSPLLVDSRSDHSAEAQAERVAIGKAAFEKAKPVTGRKPVFYVMGGGSGAGKGTLLQKLQAEGVVPTRDNGAVIIDPDHIKTNMERYKKVFAAGDYRASQTVHEDSSAMSKAILQAAKEGHYDIVFDVTMSDHDKGVARIKEFKDAGYKVKMFNVTVDPDIALERAMVRYQRTGRYVAPEVLHLAHENFNKALPDYEKLVDYFQTYSNTDQLRLERTSGNRVVGDDWNESLHPRGQPENAGEFAHKGSGSNSESFWKNLSETHHYDPVRDKELRLGKAAVDLWPAKDGSVHIVFIHSLEQGGGHASKALQYITDLADKYGVTLTLDAIPLSYKVANKNAAFNKQQLIDWYERHGFKPVGEGNVEAMMREPASKKQYQKRPLTASTERKVLFEVAPDPDNKELSGKWNKLPPETRTQVSSAVLKDVLPEVLEKTRVNAKLHMQYGGYGNDTNPSVSLVLGTGTSDEQADLLTRSLGAILDQQSMMRVSKKPFAGSNEMGAVIIKVPKNISFKSVETMYNTLRQSVLDAMGNPLINGHTTDSGRMIILVDKGTEEEIHNRVDKVLKNQYEVGYDMLHVSWPEKGDDNYGFNRQDKSGRGLPNTSIREWLNLVHAKTASQLNRYLKQYTATQ